MKQIKVAPMLSEKSSSKAKVVFAPRADTAQHVEEVTAPRLIQFGHLVQPSEPSASSNKVGIVHEYGLPGRPKKDDKHLRLPAGLQSLRKGKSEYKEEYAEEFIQAYYESGGSISRACRKSNIKFASVREWIQKYTEFKEALSEIDDIIKDEVHSQFMTRVLHEWEPNPAWKFKYFNKHFPEYSETKKSMKVSISLKDSLIRPDVIEGEVIKKELGPSDATRSEQPMEPPSNSG